MVAPFPRILKDICVFSAPLVPWQIHLHITSLSYFKTAPAGHMFVVTASENSKNKNFIFVIPKTYFKNRNPFSKTNIIRIVSNVINHFRTYLKINVSLYRNFNCVLLFCLLKHKPASLYIRNSKCTSFFFFSFFSKFYYYIKFQPNSHRCKRQCVCSSQSHSLLLWAISANVIYNKYIGFCALS